MHTGPQEHNHIHNTKKPSKQVQRNKHTLDKQLGTRLAERYIIHTAYQKYVSENKNLASDDDDDNEFCAVLSKNASKFQFQIEIKKDTTKKNVFFEWISQKHKVNPLSKSILTAMVNHFGEKVYNKNIKSYSEIKCCLQPRQKILRSKR